MICRFALHVRPLNRKAYLFYLITSSICRIFIIIFALWSQTLSQLSNIYQQPRELFFFLFLSFFCSWPFSMICRFALGQLNRKTAVNREFWQFWSCVFAQNRTLRLTINAPNKRSSLNLSASLKKKQRSNRLIQSITWHAKNRQNKRRFAVNLRRSCFCRLLKSTQRESYQLMLLGKKILPFPSGDDLVGSICGSYVSRATCILQMFCVKIRKKCIQWL